MHGVKRHFIDSHPMQSFRQLRLKKEKKILRFLNQSQIFCGRL